MARPFKQGLSYFPHDTDAHHDDKIQSLMALYGAEGYAFYFILLEKIFRMENGRITCGKLIEKAGLAKTIGITVERFGIILASALEIGCFDVNLYDNEKILTSNGIEKRIFSVNNIRYKDRNRKIKGKGKGKLKLENEWKTHGIHTENSEAAFSLFWQAYPKKQAKGNAEKVWKKLKPNAQLIEIIIQAINKAKQSNDWQKDNGQYIPLPTSWLNAKRWEDEISQPKSGADRITEIMRREK